MRSSTVMVRHLVLFSLLLSSSLACAPHKPTRPAAPPSLPSPPKDCTAITAIWDAAACDNNWSAYTCENPSENSAKKFTCPSGSTPTASSGRTTTLLNSITCDSATGGWIYDEPGPNGMQTQAEFEARMLAPPYEFSCARPNAG